jgi:spermidine/putrescine transport system ATP-binding protein
VFVTHDQEEAFTMSDRIAVMNNGLVEQAASPRSIYEEPTTVFVAEFLGVSNLLEAEAVGRDGASCKVHVRVFGGELMKATVANDGSPTPVSLDPGAAVSLRLPPSALRVLRPSEGGTDEPPADDETLLVRVPDEQVPATVPPGVAT